MSLRRSQRIHRAPKGLTHFGPYDTSTPNQFIYPSKEEVDAFLAEEFGEEVAEELVDEIFNEQLPGTASGSGSGFSSIQLANYSDEQMTQNPKSKKSTGTSSGAVAATKRERKSRSRSRSRSRKSTPVKTERRAVLVPAVSMVSPTWSEISEVLPAVVKRRSTRIAERKSNGNALNFDNTEEIPKLEGQGKTVPSSYLNSTSFLRTDFLSEHSYLLAFLRVSMLFVYIFVVYKLCVYFGADKYLASAIRNKRF